MFDDRREGPPQPSVLTIREGSGGLAPLFCVHAESGEVSLYDELASLMPEGQRVLGLCAPAGWDTPDGGGEPSIESLAARHVRTITAMQGAGPYRIVGECSGGALAFEIARQLHAGGAEVSLLALIDSLPGASPPLARSMPRPVYRALHRGRILAFHVRNLAIREARAGARIFA